MQRSRVTIVLCFLSLSVCGRPSTTPAPDKREGKNAIEQPGRTGRPTPKVHRPDIVERQPPQEQEAEAASSALEHFEDDLDAASEQLAPFADGTKDPHADLDTVKKIYKSLYPLDSFLTNYLREHRDEISDETRAAIGKVRVGVTGFNSVLLLPEDPEQPERLEDFISNTLDSFEEIKPVLRDLEAPGDPA